MNKLLRGVAVAAVTLAASSSINAANFTFTDLNLSGWYFSVANSINNSNQIAGTQRVGEARAVVWEGSNITFAPLTYKQYEYSYGENINEAGQVFIVAQLSGGRAELLWDTEKNIITPMPITPPTDPINGFDPQGRNNLGQVTGSAIFPGSPHKHAAIKDGDTLIDLGTLGGDTSYGFRITDTGFVIGGSQLANGTHGNFIWDGETMEKLQFLEGISSITPLEVNNLGQSVGFSTSIPNDYTHATLWNGRHAIDLDDFLPQQLKDEGWVLTSANDINDHGWIVGEMRNTITKQYHAYQLSTEETISPVPEPTTWAMLLAGLGLLGFVCRKSNKVNENL